MQSLLKNSKKNGNWPTDEKRGAPSKLFDLDSKDENRNLSNSCTALLQK